MVTESETRWAIDLDWLEGNHHSFTAMAKGGLCEKCRKKLKVNKGEVAKRDLLKALSACCSNAEEFITPTLPLKESIFRVFLANANKPLTLDELGQQVNERRGIDAYLVSGAVLSRLLQTDQHYGFRNVIL
jgi:hypothetical protein